MKTKIKERAMLFLGVALASSLLALLTAGVAIGWPGLNLREISWLIAVLVLAETAIAMGTRTSGLPGVLINIIAPIVFLLIMKAWGYEFGEEYQYSTDDGYEYWTEINKAVYWYWLYAVPAVRIFILEPIILVLRKVREKGAGA